jgi:hypothetical protein
VVSLASECSSECCVDQVAVTRWYVWSIIAAPFSCAECSPHDSYRMENSPLYQGNAFQDAPNPPAWITPAWILQINPLTKPIQVPWQALKPGITIVLRRAVVVNNVLLAAVIGCSL